MNFLTVFSFFSMILTAGIEQLLLIAVILLLLIYYHIHIGIMRY